MNDGGENRDEHQLGRQLLERKTRKQGLAGARTRKATRTSSFLKWRRLKESYRAEELYFFWLTIFT